MSKKSVLQKQFLVYGADSVLGHFVHCISSHFVHVTLLLINTTSLVVFDCQNWRLRQRDVRRATRELLTYILKDTPFPCAGTGKFARSRSRKYGYVASYAGETGRLPVRMVSPLSHLGNNGCLLQNCEVNMFAYLYK